MCSKTRTEDYKKYLRNNAKMLKSKQSLESDAYNVFTEKLNKIPLSFNDQKILIIYWSKIISVWRKLWKSMQRLIATCQNKEIKYTR